MALAFIGLATGPEADLVPYLTARSFGLLLAIPVLAAGVALVATLGQPSVPPSR